MKRILCSLLCAVVIPLDGRKSITCFGVAITYFLLCVYNSPVSSLLLVRTASRWSETKRGIRLPKFPHFRPTGKPDYFTAMADV